MATPAEIQAQLDTGGNMMAGRILRSHHVDATYDEHYVQGLVGFAGRARWCITTAAQTASQQAAVIATALRA